MLVILYQRGTSVKEKEKKKIKEEPWAKTGEEDHESVHECELKMRGMEIKPKIYENEYP